MRYQPGAVVDHYEVLEILGEGAYAETYRARDVDADRLVVLKSPNPQLFADPGIFQRFRREAEIVRSLDHPGVQRSFDSGEHRSEPYLVLEYIEGVNLRTRLKELGGPVPVDLAVGWGSQLASVLAYLHEHGIVHRDLKPENILVTADDQLKLADFGSALLEGARRLTWRHLSENLGTPDYMSPEQSQGERGDERSDIYAWGILMYELLTGAVPFSGDNWLAAMAGHLTRSPERIRAQREEVSPQLEAVVLHAMRRYPENRYQSAAVLLDDLSRLDSLGPAPYDLSREPPMGGLAAAESSRRLWLLSAAIAGGFLAVCALIILLTVVLR